MLRDFQVIESTVDKIWTKGKKLVQDQRKLKEMIEVNEQLIGKLKQQQAKLKKTEKDQVAHINQMDIQAQDIYKDLMDAEKKLDRFNINYTTRRRDFLPSGKSEWTLLQEFFSFSEISLEIIVHTKMFLPFQRCLRK